VSGPAAGAAPSGVPELYRSFLIAPANRADMLRKFHLRGADLNIMCLEDGTPDSEKVGARTIAADAARHLQEVGCRGRVFIRSNAPGTRWIDDDLASIVAAPVAGVCVPKVATLEQVVWIERRLRHHEAEQGRPPLQLILGIESVAGVVNAVDICTRSTRACAVYFGGEDYTTDLGGRRSREGLEFLYARSLIAMAARLAGIGAIDTATLEIREPELFRADAIAARNLGYHGRVCVHPDQVPIAHEEFGPSAAEIDRSRRLLEAEQASLGSGLAVFEFEGEMTDGPLVKRACNILAVAAEQGRAMGAPPAS